MAKNLKIGDSSPEVTKGSRAEQYWSQKGWENLFEKIRTGAKIPKSISNDTNEIAKKFNLKGIGFGNWLTIEDRLNYSYSLIYSLYDLNKVVRFNYNIGFGLLTVVFGGRGRGTALAHYEPWSQYINITRYHNGLTDKRIRFFTSGGVGSLAHEYGHFLDYFAGEYLAPNIEQMSLSGGVSLAVGRIESKQKLRILMNDILEAIIWKNDKEYSRYYSDLLDFLKRNKNLGDYWKRRNEIFARAFEVYVSEKLAQNNINNRLLAKTKYISSVYLRKSEIKPIIPLFDKLMAEIRKDIK